MANKPDKPDKPEKPKGFQGGRDKGGRFLAGKWPGGPGNPFAAKSQRLRAIWMRELSPQKMRKIVKKLIEKAADGEMSAISEILNRTLGKPTTKLKVSGSVEHSHLAAIRQMISTHPQISVLADQLERQLAEQQEAPAPLPGPNRETPLLPPADELEGESNGN